MTSTRAHGVREMYVPTWRKYEGEDERSRFFPHQITLLDRHQGGKKRINWNDLFPFSSF